MLIYIYNIITFLFFFVSTIIIYKNGKLIKELKKELDIEKEKNKKVVSQRKSSEVRLGKIGENMAPFFKDWPFDPNKFRFLGNPIDGIQFNNDEILFIEIKTGKSRLSTSQKKIKQLIKEKKVAFATFRVSEEACLLKVE